MLRCINNYVRLHIILLVTEAIDLGFRQVSGICNIGAQLSISDSLEPQNVRIDVRRSGKVARDTRM